jgi:6-phosphogluconolactonase
VIEIVRLKTPEQVSAEAASRVAIALADALQTQEVATFVLAGGRLPPIANGILSEKYTDAIDWSRVIFLIGDERCVPLDNPDSSWLSALAMFEGHPEIPENNKLRPKSNLSAEQAAASYERTILKLPKHHSGLPVFNHLWLGIGEDGHTLSIFPNHASMELAQQTDALVIAVHDSPKPPPDRISLSLKALKGVESALVFMSGVGKAPIVAQIADGDTSLPIVVASQTIINAGGRVTWLIDDDAASLLTKDQNFTSL